MSTPAVENLHLPEDLNGKAKIRKLQLKDLQVDRSYQRDPSQRLVESIADNWDVVASELILASDRGSRPAEGPVVGGLFVINGQHRTLAARRLGISSIDARVLDLSSYDDPGLIEAGLRLKTNVRLGDRPTERFKAQLRAGDEESLAIAKLLARFDTQINSVPNQDTGINSVTGVEQLYRYDQGGLLAEILETIRAGMGDIHGKHAAITMLKSVGWFLLKHSDDMDKGRFVSKLTYGAEAIDRKARAQQAVIGGALWQNYYRALLEMYNEKLQQRSRMEPSLRGSTTWTSGGMKFTTLGQN